MKDLHAGIHLRHVYMCPDVINGMHESSAQKTHMFMASATSGRFTNTASQALYQACVDTKCCAIAQGTALSCVLTTMSIKIDVPLYEWAEIVLTGCCMLLGGQGAAEGGYLGAGIPLLRQGLLLRSPPSSF